MSGDTSAPEPAEGASVAVPGESATTDERRLPAPARTLRQLFGSRDFRRLFAAHTISRWGDTFNAVALVIVVFQLTGSGLRVAGTVALEIAPVLLLGFFAGAFVDRHPRRRVMIAADLGRAAVAIGLAAFGDSLAVIYASAVGGRTR